MQDGWLFSYQFTVFVAADILVTPNTAQSSFEKIVMAMRSKQLNQTISCCSC